MGVLDAALAAQRAYDTAMVGARPELLKRKRERMLASPLGFLRGAAPFFAALLKLEPGVLQGLPGATALVGDLHLENFGTWRDASGALRFHVNDFDESFDGPVAYDLLRLVTSVLLSREQLEVSGSQALELARAVLEGHVKGIRGAPLKAPELVQRLLREAGKVGEAKLAERRLASSTRFLREPRQPPAPRQLVAQVPRLLQAWVESLPEAERPGAAALTLHDVVRRISGTGSLGAERLLALVAGDETGPWLLELKAARAPCASPEAHAGAAAHVVAAERKALKAPPGLFGFAEGAGASFVVHRMRGGEGKLEVAWLREAKAEPRALEALFEHLGHLAGEAHRAGSDWRLPYWSPAQHTQALDAARTLAAQHLEAFFLFSAAA